MTIEGAHPLFFGTGGDMRLFGWFHGPVASGRAATAGVVICNPFGFEEVAAHRGIRALANALAAQGIPCLRFDYLGCGNSASLANSNDQVAGWLESIDEAIVALKQLADVETVVLVGFRLGGALAAMRCAVRRDVFGLVAFSPVVQGRRYLREQRLLSDAVDSDTGGVGPSIVLEPSGFPITESTYSTITAIDLERTSACASRVLLIEEPLREPESLAWYERQAEDGASVDRWVVEGYSALTDDPQTAIVPGDLFRTVVERLVRWTCRSAADGPEGFRSSRPPLPIPTPTMEFDEQRRLHARADVVDADAASTGAHGVPGEPIPIVERIVSIPTGNITLFGIVTQPAVGPPEGDLLLLNAGAVRHTGPNRLWVNLARSWAARGHRVMRFDFSGLGDSPTRDDAEPGDSYSEFAQGEIAAALAFLGSDRSADRDVQLVGLCSGAYHAFRAAIDGLPVRSATLINPLAFASNHLRGDAGAGIASYEVLELYAQYRRKVGTRDFWAKLVHGRIDIATIRKVVWCRLRLSLRMASERLRRLVSSQAAGLSGDIENVLRRGVQLNLIFSASDPGLELLRRQIGNRLDGLLHRDGFRVDVIADADHTFTSTASRRDLVATLDELRHFRSNRGHSRRD